METRTVDSILQEMEEKASNNYEMSPGWWVNNAVLLTALKGNEDDRLAHLAQRLSKMKAAYIEEGRKITEAKILTESTDTYLEYLKLEAKISRIDNQIMNAKKMASLKEDTYIHG